MAHLPVLIGALMGYVGWTIVSVCMRPSRSWRHRIAEIIIKALAGAFLCVIALVVMVLGFDPTNPSHWTAAISVVIAVISTALPVYLISNPMRSAPTDKRNFR